MRAISLSPAWLAHTEINLSADMRVVRARLMLDQTLRSLSQGPRPSYRPHMQQQTLLKYQERWPHQPSIGLMSEGHITCFSGRTVRGLKSQTAATRVVVRTGQSSCRPPLVVRAFCPLLVAQRLAASPRRAQETLAPRLNRELVGKHQRITGSSETSSVCAMFPKGMTSQRRRWQTNTLHLAMQ